MNNKFYIDKLKEDINNMEEMINNPWLHNARVFASKLVVKSGLALNKCLPLIFSSFILYNGFSLINAKPFIIDDKVVKLYQTTTINSNNEIEKSYSETKRNIIEYITKDEKTVYDYNKIGEYSYETILKLTKEELDTIFPVLNKEIIINEYIENEIVNDIISISITSDNELSAVRNETERDNFCLTIIYLGLDYFLTIFLSTTYIYRNLSTKLRSIDAGIIVVNSKNIKELNEILSLRKENFELITDNSIWLKDDLGKDKILEKKMIKYE